MKNLILAVSMALSSLFIPLAAHADAPPATQQVVAQHAPTEAKQYYGHRGGRGFEHREFRGGAFRAHERRVDRSVGWRRHEHVRRGW